MIGRKMTIIKKSEISVSAKNNASTSCDVVEACGGKRRNWSISQFASKWPPAGLRAIEKTHQAIAARNPKLTMRRIDRISPPYFPVIGL